MVTPASDSPASQPDIGPFKLLERLGEGGMGEVWLAEQREPVRRRVALKIIKLGMDTNQFLARLEAERQALAVMDHPNIARFLSAGATETGRPYFVMELVRGVPLTHYCDTNRLSTDERIRLFIDVCHAVQHAHHKGVVHRDLKPSNILVTVRDNRPVVKIIDFGIAKAMGQELTDRTLVTRLGQIIGTPEYMSPEQAEMSGLDVDTRSDVYSLGVLLYELLVGALPLDLNAWAKEAVQYAIRETDVPRPSTKLTSLGETQEIIAQHRKTTPDALRRELKSDLDWIILKAMEKDRTRRYETSNALALDLERHLSDEPVLARAPSAAYRMGKFVRRHRLQVVFGSVVGILLMAFSIGMSVQAARIAAERDRAEEEAAKAQAVNDFMTNTLLSPDPVNGLGADATILEALDAAVARMGDKYSENPEVDAAVRSSIGWAYFSLSRYDEAKPLLEEALRIRKANGDRETAEVASSLLRLGVLEEALAQRDSAESLYKGALAILRQTLAADDGTISDVLVRYSGLLMGQGRFEEAEDLLKEAVGLLERDREHPLGLSAATNRLGELYWTLGNFESAEPLLRRTLAVRQEHLDPAHPLVGESLNNLAVLLEDMGRTEEAEAYYREALAFVEGAFGDSSDHVSAILGNLALILSKEGKTAEAEGMFRRALSIDLELLGPDHPSVAIDRVNLGLLLCDDGRATEGVSETAEALGTLSDVLQPGQWELGAVRSAHGHCLTQSGRFREGEVQLLAALETLRAALGDDHPRIGITRARLVELYEAWGKPDEARKYSDSGSDGPRTDLH